MVSSPESTPSAGPSQGNLLHRFASNPLQFGYGLIAAGLVLAVAPLVLAIKYKSEYLLECLILLIPPLTGLATGFYLSVIRRDKPCDVDTVRMLVLIFGGMLGLTLLLVSFALTYRWWNIVAGGLSVWQGPEGKWLWVLVLLQIGGLAIMFASLQLVRAEERSSSVLRRMIYGYNAGLTGLLLLQILGVLNVLTGNFLPASDDWTAKSMYSLSSSTENLLKHVDKPVKIYSILSSGRDFLTLRNVRGLLDNCQAVTDRIQVEYLSPDLDREKVVQLAQQYKFSGDREGILVVYGTEPNIESQFIKKSALNSAPESFMRQREPQFFKGEAELVSVLKPMVEGKDKAIIYFTQGQGELDITDLQARQPDKGLGVLKRRLEGENMVVKGLELTNIEGRKSKNPDIVISTTVPKDATVVVVAGPHQRFSASGLKALRDYMNGDPSAADKRKGKLVVLFDVTLTTGGAARREPTGLEDLVAEYNVKVDDNIVLQAGINAPPLVVPAVTNPSEEYQARNPVAAAFPDPFLFYQVRTVEPQTQNRPDSSRFQAESFLLIPAQANIWTETNLGSDFVTRINKLLQGDERELRQKFSSDSLSMAVTVMEQPPRTDPHAIPQPGDSKPRLVVFGDATWVGNIYMQENRAGRYYDLFTSLLGWLREKPTSIGVEAKKQDVYEVDPANLNVRRMVLLPAVLLFFAIAGLGAGVWVVRRR
jgi:hypothetical protein